MLHVVGSCSAKFETGQKFEPTSPNISFVPWSPKRSATMLDQFTQLFQHCQSHARVFHMVSFKLQFLIGCILPKMHSVSGPKIVGVVASVYRCSFMRLNDAFFLCPPKALFSMLYSKLELMKPLLFEANMIPSEAWLKSSGKLPFISIYHFISSHEKVKCTSGKNWTNLAIAEENTCKRNG